MKKEKFKNPNIICVITYSIITVVYAVMTCIEIYQGEIVGAMIFACLTAVWGVLTGLWIYKALTYKRMTFLEEERYRLILLNIKLTQELDRKYKEEKDER